MKLKLYNCALLVILATVWLPAQTSNQSDRIHASITAYLERQHIPSAAVAIVEHSGAVHEWTFGEADPGTRYPFASVTKSLTATLIMILADRGELDLDTPVAQYLDSIITYPDPRWERVTVRNLLTHTSGMGMYYRIYYADESAVPAPVSELIERHGYLLHDPGTHFEYSNLGYAILGEVAARVTGTSFPAALRTYVLDPLEMQHTRIGVNTQEDILYATLYGIEREQLPLVFTDTPAAGDGYGTVGDLARFGAYHLGQGPELMSDEARLEMYRGADTTEVTYANPCHRYGLGFYLDPSAGPEAVYLWHDGGVDGAGSTLRLLPGQGIAVAVLTPVTFTVGASDSIADIVLTALSSQKTPAACTQVDGTYTPADWYGEWSGEVVTPEGGIPLSIDIREDSMVVASFVQPQSSMIFTGGASFPLRIIVDQFGGTANRITGWIPTGLINTSELKDDFHIVLFELTRSGEVLQGTAKAFATNTGREGFGITYPLRLSRMEEAE